MNNKFLPLSPSELSMFIDCPRKFWLKKEGIRPLPQDNEFAVFGRNFHQIVAEYYRELQGKESFSADMVHDTFRDIIKKNKHIIDDMQKYTFHFRRFEQFEADRLGWSDFKPVLVEKYKRNNNYKGVADVVFNTPKGKLIVDWKTGAMKDWHSLQGCIYMNLADADRVMFFYTLRGRKVELTNNQIRKAEEQVKKLVKEMKDGINQMKEGRHCEYCEFSLACRLRNFNLSD